MVNDHDSGDEDEQKIWCDRCKEWRRALNIDASALFAECRKCGVYIYDMKAFVDLGPLVITW